MKLSFLWLVCIHATPIQPGPTDRTSKVERLKNAIYAPLMALKRSREDRFQNRLMFNQFYIADNQICEAIIAVYRTKDPRGKPEKELKSEACEDINELRYTSILEKEIKEFNELKKEAKLGSVVQGSVSARTMNEKRRKLWELLAVPRQKWPLYYVKYRSEERSKKRKLAEQHAAEATQKLIKTELKQSKVFLKENIEKSNESEILDLDLIEFGDRRVVEEESFENLEKIPGEFEGAGNEELEVDEIEILHRANHAANLEVPQTFTESANVQVNFLKEMFELKNALTT